MDKQYCTIQDIENYLNVDIEASLEPQVLLWVEAMSNYVSLQTNREWLADSSASERFYNGNGCQSMEVDEFIEVSNVYLGDSFGENFEEETSYITHPYNSTVKNTFVLQSNFFPKTIKSVKINAKWGYGAEVPEDIKLATSILVAGVYNNQRGSSGEIKSEKIGNYNVSYETNTQKDDFEKAKTIIDSRKVIRI